MISAVALVTPITFNSKAIQKMKAVAAEKGVDLDIRLIFKGTIGEYKPRFAENQNIITWSYRMPHSWMVKRKKNILFVDNSLIAQRSGMFVDNRGLFSQSHIAKESKGLSWLKDGKRETDYVKLCAPFKWVPFGGGDPSGPILVCLQCRNDATLKYEFPLAAKEPDKVVATLQILKQHLPKGRKILIRPHPRERGCFETGGVWRPDWHLDMEGSFSERLPQCSALVAVNSTCLTEAALLGIPSAALGTGTFTGNSIALDCSANPALLGALDLVNPRQDNLKGYISAMMTDHFMPYDGSRTCGEFERWLETASKTGDSPANLLSDLDQSMPDETCHES